MRASARSRWASSLLVLSVLAACTTGTPAVTPSRSASQMTASPGASSVSSPPAPSIFPDGLISIAVRPEPKLLLAGDDAIWATFFPEDGPRRIVRIDPETYAMQTVLDDLPAEQLGGVGVGGSLWVVNSDTSSVTEYDIASGEELATLPVGETPIEPVVAFGDLWSIDHEGGTVTRIDVDSSSVVATIEVSRPGGGGPTTSGVAAGLLWVAAPNTPRVVGIDPETNRVVRTLDLEPDCRPGITAAAELLWLRGCLYRGGDVIDARTLEPVGTRRDVPEWFGALGSQLVVDDRVWLAEWRPHRELITQLVAVDLESLTVVDQYEIEVRLPAAVVAFDSLWFASGPTILRLPASALHEE